MDKAKLRRAVIARRDAIDLDVRAAKSAVICARLVERLGRSDPAAPHTVAVYAAMGSEVCRGGRQTRLARGLSVHALGSRSHSLWPAHVHAGSCCRRCVRGSVYRPPHAGLHDHGHRQRSLPYRACRCSRHDYRAARGLRPNRRAPGLRRRLLRPLPTHAFAHMSNHRHRL